MKDVINGNTDNISFTHFYYTLSSPLLRSSESFIERYVRLLNMQSNHTKTEIAIKIARVYDEMTVTLKVISSKSSSRHFMRYLFIKGAIASEIKNDTLTTVCIINVMTKKMLRDVIPRVLYNANDLILRLKKSCESAYITPASRIIRKNDMA